MKVMPVKPPDKGLLLSSHVDFTIPSPFAQEHLYYLIQYGRYQCVPGYEVERDFLDMYLCAYVRSGSLHTFCGEQSANATAGQLVLMDCRLPHRYCVTEPTELLWFHFSGGESAASTVQATFPAYSAAVKNDAEQIPFHELLMLISA